MKLINRETYLIRLISLKGTPDIKVITGIRRSGKSKLLEEYIDWIEAQETDSNIIFIDLTQLKYEALKEYHALNDYIEDKKSMEKKNFHFLSEDIVQSFDEAKNNPALQVQVVREANRFEDKENDMFNHKDYNDRDDR